MTAARKRKRKYTPPTLLRLYRAPVDVPLAVALDASGRVLIPDAKGQLRRYTVEVVRAGVWRLTGPKGQQYIVTGGGEFWHCTCPDAYFRPGQTCKHAIGLRALFTVVDFFQERG